MTTEILSILDLFPEESRKQKNDGNWQTECPDCGLQGGRTEGFILFPTNNTAYCHSSGKHFSYLETYALRKKIIRCLDGKETGEKRNILVGEQFKETLDLLKEEYGDEKYNNILSVIGIRKAIQLPNDGKLVSQFASELARVLRRENIFFYRAESKEIVEIGKIKHPNGCVEYSGFIPVDANRFVTIIERYFRPWAKVYTKIGSMDVTKSMSQTVANTVMVSDNFRDTMPLITKIFTVPMPILYNNTLTFPSRGYDKRFGSFLAHNAPEISNQHLPLEEAKKIIEFIYSGFCYQSEQDKINDIASLLTPFVRGLYVRSTCRTPLFVRKANRERAGKDYDEGVRSILYEGVALEEPPIANNEHSASGHNDELRKKIMSTLLAGRKKIHFSNNKGLINNAVFESILTAEHFSDRKLGSNTTLSFPNELEFSISGNIGMGMTPDLINRSRVINLFLDVEDANSRTFPTADLHGWVLANRSLILSALFAMVREWVNKGMICGSVPFTSYPEWARVVGGIMECCGYGSPCNPDKELLGIAADSETSDMKSLFELCYFKKPDTWMTKKEIHDLIINSDENLFPYIDWDKKADQTKFALKFNRFVGRVLSDIRLVVKDRNARPARWEFMFCKEVSTYSCSRITEPILVENEQKIGNLGNLGNFKPPVENTIRIEEIRVEETLPSLPTLPKSDREVQFWEAEECKDIVCKTTHEEVLDFIKANPITWQQLDEKFGVGSLRIKNELIKDGKIKQEGDLLCLI